MWKERKIINQAQVYLENQPIDAAHDLAHHSRVARNCQLIIKAEHLRVNRTNVMIAAWWHDVESQEGETNLLEKEMKKGGFDENTSWTHIWKSTRNNRSEDSF
ncbi:hypothetical protein HYW87_03905 [Candidatus Roizmanbacteria bacterium]|nr:hypothetical protein [Candidatus Roizmanbacteria bacterium]